MLQLSKHPFVLDVCSLTCDHLQVQGLGRGQQLKETKRQTEEEGEIKTEF